VGARLPGEWHFRYRGALRQKLFEQCDIFGRIDPVVAAGEHGHSAGAQARAMRGGSALLALPDLARRGGLKRSPRICSREQAEAELTARAAGVEFLTLDEHDYPARLRMIDDPPPVLALRGNIDALARPLIGIVGSRNASAAGIKFAQRIARDLGDAGFTVVSGLARRMDTPVVPDKIMKGTRADVFAADQPEPIETRIFGLSRITQRLPPRFHPRQHYNRFLADTTISLARAFCLCADPAFGAAEQARDVFPVLDPQQ
jgi:hypothetical protein